MQMCGKHYIWGFIRDEKRRSYTKTLADKQEV